MLPGFDNIEPGQSWNHRILAITFKAIIKLIKKEDWTDIEQAVALIQRTRWLGCVYSAYESACEPGVCSVKERSIKNWDKD